MSETERRLDIPLVLERGAANADSMEIPVSFASDKVIDDPYIGPVKLSMEASAVDLSQWDGKGIPVREMHQRTLPVARVMDPKIDGGKLRGVMRFSQSDRGKSLYRDAVDGIITDLSVGARIFTVRQEQDYLVALRWMPAEVSIVEEGADQSVGINRSTKPTPAAVAAPSSTGDNTMAEEKPAVEVTRAATQIDTIQAQEAANIMELARYGHSRAPELGIDKMGEDAIAFGTPFVDFRAEVKRMMMERKAKEPAIAAPPAEIGLTGKETQQFSIVRAAYAYLNHDWKNAGFELECSRAVADRLGRSPQGFFVPLEVQRTMTVGAAATGGTLVGTDHRADLFIDSLRATAVAFQAGARMLPGLVGNVSIPKKTSKATFAWLAEGGDVTTSDLGTGTVSLSPHTIGGGIPMTRRLLQQSSPAVEQLVRQDLIEGAALAIDLAIFEGSGASNQPTGVANAASVNTVTITVPGSPDWSDIVEFETAVAADNALAGSLSFVTTAAVRGAMKTTPKESGQAIYLMNGSQANGYEVRVSTQLSANRIMFGDWSQVIVGFWGVLDVKPDEATLAASGGLILRAFQDVDIGIRHDEAFAINA